MLNTEGDSPQKGGIAFLDRDDRFGTFRTRSRRLTRNMVLGHLGVSFPRFTIY